MYRVTLILTSLKAKRKKLEKSENILLMEILVEKMKKRISRAIRINNVPKWLKYRIKKEEIKFPIWPPARISDPLQKKLWKSMKKRELRTRRRKRIPPVLAKNRFLLLIKKVWKPM